MKRILSANILFATYLTKFSRDLVIPVLPIIGAFFGLTGQLVEWNVSIYFLGILFSRLLWPPISDVFSRKHILLLCLSLFLLSNIIILGSVNPIQFLILRFIQGFAIAALPVIVRAYVYEQTDKLQTFRLFAYLSLLTAWAPAIATAIGGVLAYYYGWQSIFHLLIGLSFLGFLLYVPMPVTRLENITHKHLHLWTAAKAIVSNIEFWAVALPFSLLTAGLAVYFTITPYLFLLRFGISSAAYGFFTFYIIAGMSAGMFVSGLLAEKLALPTIITYGLLCAIVASVLFVIMVLLFHPMVSAIIVFVCLFMFGVGLLTVTVKTQVMELFNRSAGTVLAIIGAFEALVSSVFSGISALLNVTSTLTLAVMLFTLALLASLTFYGLSAKST